MDIVEAKFVSNKTTEAERIIHTAKQVWVGFYEKKGFVVLPELGVENSGVIVLPNIGLEKIGKVSELLRRTKLNFPIKTNKEFFTEVVNKLETDGVGELILSRIQEEWKKVEGEFWRVSKVLVPEWAGKLDGLEVRVTEYGSISSYKFLNELDHKLIVYLRKDAGVSHLAEAILTGLVYPCVNTMGLTWEEGEAIVDFTLKNTVLSKVLGIYVPTLTSLRSAKSKEILEKSKKYLVSLGVRLETSLKIVNNRIELYGESIEKELTGKQTKLLKGLLESDKNLLTFDEVGIILWGDDENKYSLWALNKFIERLRNKLVGLGMSPYNLRTLRGKGCCLDI